MDDQELDRRTSLPPRRVLEEKYEEALCKHRIIAEWCWECKHTSKTSVKSLLLQENLRISENFLTWKITNRTT